MPPMKYMYTETHLNELDTWICNVVTLQDSSMVFWKSSVKEMTSVLIPRKWAAKCGARENEVAQPGLKSRDDAHVHT